MKKIFLLLNILFFVSRVFSQNLPDDLCGIWEGKDRYVFFEKNQQSENPQIVILLKEYYGWYVDRAAEPSYYAEKEKRTRNSATTKTAEHIVFDVSELKNSSKVLQKKASAYEVFLKYSSKEENRIPILVINDSIFLDFYIQDVENKNLYIGNALSKGFTLNNQLLPEKLSAFYVGQDGVYDIRYWQTDMDYSEDTALFKREEIQFSVPKHVFSAGQNYSCVSGRSIKIRNPQPSVSFKESGLIRNQNEINNVPVIIKGNEPYLIKLADKNTFEDLIKIVKESNSKRVPDPKPVFPPSDLNWHWDVINLLEKNNPLIQQVRKRQLEFGSRGHD